MIDKNELLKLLPKLIREDDEIKGAIITALSGVVATKEDIARIIEHSNRRFEAMEQQMDKRFEAMQQQMDKRFEAMEQQMDKRFEAMQQQMDKRFEAMEQQMDKRFEAMQQQMDKRFEAVDKRFEAIDKRFEAIDKRFEAIDKRFKMLISQMNKGFEEAHRHRESLEASQIVIRQITGEILENYATKDDIKRANKEILDYLKQQFESE
ncbi:MAG: hypothetical protein ACTSQG_08860 [Promethearchaeota archaeon]